MIMITPTLPMLFIAPLSPPQNHPNRERRKFFDVCSQSHFAWFIAHQSRVLYGILAEIACQLTS